MGAFDPIVTYEKGTYIETDTGRKADGGDKVSRKAFISGATNIILGGKSIISPGAILRGDLRRNAAGQHVVITMGRYCSIGENSIIRPPGKIYKGTFTYYPVRMGDFVSIGKDCIVEAAQIGSGVEIGEGAIIGKFAVIKDLAVIRPYTVLPEGAVVASMTVWEGNPGRHVDMLPETFAETVEMDAKGNYQRFRPA